MRTTIATLARGNFSGSLYVVAPSDEVAAYTKALSGAAIHCIVLHTTGGPADQRRFFRAQMAENTPIVWIRDDVEAIKFKTPTGVQHCRVLNMLADHMIQILASTEDGLLLGVYPVVNSTWMSPKIYQNNSYINGAFYLSINDARLTEEDDEWTRALSEQAEGRPVLRLNYIGVQTLRGYVAQESTLAACSAKYSKLVKRIVRKSGESDLRYLSDPKPYTPPTAPTDLSGNTHGE